MVCAHAYHTLSVVAGSGVTAGVVALQLSNDGVNWWQPGSATTTLTAAGTTAVSVGPIRGSVCARRNHHGGHWWHDHGTGRLSRLRTDYRNTEAKSRFAPVLRWTAGLPACSGFLAFRATLRV
jgi:hypothetical protein